MAGNLSLKQSTGLYFAEPLGEFLQGTYLPFTARVGEGEARIPGWYPWWTQTRDFSPDVSIIKSEGEIFFIGQNFLYLVAHIPCMGGIPNKGFVCIWKKSLGDIKIMLGVILKSLSFIKIRNTHIFQFNKYFSGYKNFLLW